jgi:hypothetical protein
MYHQSLKDFAKAFNSENEFPLNGISRSIGKLYQVPAWCLRDYPGNKHQIVFFAGRIDEETALVVSKSEFYKEEQRIIRYFDASAYNVWDVWHWSNVLEAQSQGERFYL